MFCQLSQLFQSRGFNPSIKDPSDSCTKNNISKDGMPDALDALRGQEYALQCGDVTTGDDILNLKP